MNTDKNKYVFGCSELGGKMDRKLRVMGIYIGLLFFVSILLILVTSFSNNKMEPSYDVETEQQQNQISFDRTMEQSVNTLTENNRILHERVEDLNFQLDEKDKLIEEYKSLYNEDVLKLQNAMKLYINDWLEESKNILSTINIENLNEEEVQVYNNLVNKLN